LIYKTNKIQQINIKSEGHTALYTREHAVMMGHYGAKIQLSALFLCTKTSQKDNTSAFSISS
ncbi:TPA: hypothetical protein ACGE45_004983, partial [Klebsiella pneumoniae]